MADGRIGHKALDVGLADRGDGTQGHRQHRDEDDDLAPLGQQIWKRTQDRTQKQTHRCNLGGSGEEGGYRGGGAFINVGRPHMERHSGHLESKTGNQEHNSEDNTQAGAADHGDIGDGRELGRTSEAINQRNTIQQHARGQRAQDEIFQARLTGTKIISGEGGKHI